MGAAPRLGVGTLRARLLEAGPVSAAPRFLLGSEDVLRVDVTIATVLKFALDVSGGKDRAWFGCAVYWSCIKLNDVRRICQPKRDRD